MAPGSGQVVPFDFEPRWLYVGDVGGAQDISRVMFLLEANSGAPEDNHWPTLIPENNWGALLPASLFMGTDDEERRRIEIPVLKAHSLVRARVVDGTIGWFVLDGLEIETQTL
jgi:hypothetical protein